jgi:signal transduction histidine kinase
LSECKPFIGFIGARLSRQLAALVLGAFALSCALYLTFQPIVSEAVCNHFEAHPELSKGESAQLLASLKADAISQNIAANDAQALSSWVRRHSLIILTVYRNGALLYDSSEHTTSMLHAHVTQPPLVQRDYDNAVQFADGIAQVSISAFPEYRIADLLSRVLLIINALLFLGCLLIGIRRKVRALLRLEREVLSIAGGDMRVAITRSGSDELALLAQSVDDMRVSITDRARREELILHERSEWTTALSHDLRTPLTVLRGYLEVLRKSSADEDHCIYLDKCIVQAERLKDMTDMLFSCFSTASLPSQTVSQQPAALFVTMLKEHAELLTHNGFTIREKYSINEASILIHIKSVERVLDNVFSNVEKYASHELPVYINVSIGDDRISIEISSSSYSDKHVNGGTGLGLAICANLIHAMGGNFETDDAQGRFTYRVELLINETA